MSFIYARVSSHDQKADLDRQIQKLQTVSPESHVVSDIRSGMKFNRKGKRYPEVKKLAMRLDSELVKIVGIHLPGRHRRRNWRTALCHLLIPVE